jgi:hypothetical protein
MVRVEWGGGERGGWKGEGLTPVLPDGLQGKVTDGSHGGGGEGELGRLSGVELVA